jgi:hypothetical protein
LATAVFRPRLRATIPPGWRGWEWRHAILLFRRDEHCELHVDSFVAARAEERIEALHRMPELDPTDVRASRVAGFPATGFDADVLAAVDLDEETGTRVEPGDRIRVIAFAHPASVVTITLVAAAEDFERHAGEAAPIVETVRLLG